MALVNQPEVNSTGASGDYRFIAPEPSDKFNLGFWYLSDVISPVPLEPRRQKIVPRPPELERARKFRELAKRWEADTVNSSFAAEMAEHPAYREIVDMGKPAVPYIMAELDRKPGHWFIALEHIMEEDPVQAKERGKVLKMTEAWLRWGRDQGYY